MVELLFLQIIENRTKDSRFGDGEIPAAIIGAFSAS